MKTLTWFYEIIQSTIAPRRELVNTCLLKDPSEKRHIDHLKRILDELLEISSKNKIAVLSIGHDKMIELELSYEINELQKDLLFLEEGRDALELMLIKSDPLFKKESNALIDFLSSQNIDNWITDRDGTINNYCGRYLSSIQSVYNAVFVSEFSRTCTQSCILTSAPLSNGGLIDISVQSSKNMILAGSKGREYLTPNGKIGSFSIPEEQALKLRELNRELTRLLEDEQYRIFKLIGSGLQYKFGQTTIARQDVSSSIPELKSTAFLIKVENLLKRLDPDNQYFRIEDTGLDIEIILTVSDSGSDSLKDFDKGDGLSFLNTELSLNLSDGKTLICGDTFSDLAMVKKSIEITGTTIAIFVTTDEKLKKELSRICPKSILVSSPDVLVWSLMSVAD